MRRKFNSDFSIPPQPVKSEHSRVTHRRTVFRSIRTKHSLTIERFVKLNIRPVNKFQPFEIFNPKKKKKLNSTQRRRRILDRTIRFFSSKEEWKKKFVERRKNREELGSGSSSLESPPFPSNLLERSTTRGGNSDDQSSWKGSRMRAGR